MQWNIVLSLFFVPYILLEVPSNVLLKRCARPSIYMGVLVTTWGIIMTMHGVVTNYAGLLALRILLGVFEAGFFPGAVYLCVSANTSPSDVPELTTADLLVHAARSRRPHLLVLLLQRPFGGFFWHGCRRDCADGRRWWLRGLALDIFDRGKN